MFIPNQKVDVTSRWFATVTAHTSVSNSGNIHQMIRW
jgi:hypothetical protein